MRLLKTVPLTEEELEKVRPLMVEEAERRLRAGVTLDLDAFDSLTEDEQAAFVEAGNRISAERAAMTGLAARSDLGAAEVLSALDGGAARTDLLLTAACMAVGQKMKGKKTRAA